jgi:hypothetical protein
MIEFIVLLFIIFIIIALYLRPRKGGVEEKKYDKIIEIKENICDRHDKKTDLSWKAMIHDYFDTAMLR